MMKFLVFIGAWVSASPNSAPVTILEMSRSLPAGIQETVIVRYVDGAEVVMTTSNRFMPDRPEVGVFKRTSALLMNKLKVLKESKVAGKPSFHPHEWRVRVFGKEIPGGDPRILDAEVAVSEELKASGWVAAETAKVEIKTLEAVFTYSRPGVPAQVEKQKLSAACRAVEGKMMCTSKLGYVFLK